MIGQIFSMDRRKCAITQLETDLPGKLLTSYLGQLRPYLAF